MQIAQVATRVHDIDRATQFYEQSLGLPLLFRAGTLSFFDLGRGVRLMLSPASAPEFDHPGSVLYLQVTDITARHQALAARGVTFRDTPHLVARMPDHELWMAFFLDSEGNTLALMEEVRKAT